jgi:hypothetical protein
MLFHSVGDATKDAAASTDDPSTDQVGDPTLFEVRSMPGIPGPGTVGTTVLVPSLPWLACGALRGRP